MSPAGSPEEKDETIEERDDIRREDGGLLKVPRIVRLPSVPPAEATAPGAIIATVAGRAAGADVTRLGDEASGPTAEEVVLEEAPPRVAGTGRRGSPSTLGGEFPANENGGGPLPQSADLAPTAPDAEPRAAPDIDDTEPPAPLNELQEQVVAASTSTLDPNIVPFAPAQAAPAATTASTVRPPAPIIAAVMEGTTVTTAPDDDLDCALEPGGDVGDAVQTDAEATGSDSSSDESEELVRMTEADERRLYSVDALTERFHEKRSVEAAAPVVVCDEVTALKVALTHQSLLSKGGAASLLSHAVLANMYNCKTLVEYHRSWMTGVFDLLSADGSACQKAFLEKKRAYEKEMGDFLEFKRDLGETARKTVAAFKRAELCKTRVTKHFLYAIQKAVARKFGKAGTEPYRLTVDVLLTQGLFDREGIDDGWDRISWKTRKTFAEALMSRPRKEHHALMVGMRFLAEVRPGLDPLVLGEDPTDSFNIRLHEAIKKYKAEISD